MSISAAILKVLKIVVWPIAYVAVRFVAHKKPVSEEPIRTAVSTLEMAELIRNTQAKSNAEFEKLHPRPVLRPVGSRGAVA